MPEVLVVWSRHQKAGLTIASSSKESVIQWGRHPTPVIHGCSEGPEALPLKGGIALQLLSSTPVLNKWKYWAAVKVNKVSDHGVQDILPTRPPFSPPVPISYFCPFHRQVSFWMRCQQESICDFDKLESRGHWTLVQVETDTRQTHIRSGAFSKNKVGSLWPFCKTYWNDNYGTVRSLRYRIRVSSSPLDVWLIDQTFTKKQFYRSLIGQNGTVVYKRYQTHFKRELKNRGWTEGYLFEKKLRCWVVSYFWKASMASELHTSPGELCSTRGASLARASLTFHFTELSNSLLKHWQLAIGNQQPPLFHISRFPIERQHHSSLYLLPPFTRS